MQSPEMRVMERSVLDRVPLIPGFPFFDPLKKNEGDKLPIDLYFFNKNQTEI